MASVRWLIGTIMVVSVAGALWYLRDPPWVAAVTSGMRDWEVDPTGTRFRWTAGHASFFVPSAASEMTVPIRALFPSSDGRPVVVRFAVDDRSVATVELINAAEWSRPVIPLPRRTGRRHYRRVDVRVSRVVGFYNLGVQVGEPTLR
jgi:hypothetical protein